MPLVYFVTHPDVSVDPSIPVPEWGLSQRGIERMHLFAAQPWLCNVRSIFCSDERKATDGARILAGALKRDYVVHKALGENDRSATGYVPKPEFEKAADAFFAQPDVSVRGWERAADAQRRIIFAMETILKDADKDGDLAVISHGGVGALYLCHLKGIAISRSADQPPGNGGNFYVFESSTRRLLLDWRPIDN